MNTIKSIKFDKLQFIYIGMVTLLHKSLAFYCTMSSSDHDSSDEDSESRIDAVKTDPSYLKWIKTVWNPKFSKKLAMILPPEQAYLQWLSQRKVCACTQMPFTIIYRKDISNAYDVDVIRLDNEKPTSYKHNFVFVHTYIAKMYKSVESFVPSFEHFVKMISVIQMPQ